MGLGRGFDLWAVDSGNGTMKRPLENGKPVGKAKRACTEGIGTSRDVDEFLALLERIEATEKQFGAPRRVNNNNKPLHPLHTDKDADTSWKPSFQWKDFCTNRIGTRDVDRSPASEAHAGCSSKGNRPPNDFNNNNKRECLYLDQNNNGDTEGATERLDLNLNLPSTSGGLQLFY